MVQLDLRISRNHYTTITDWEAIVEASAKEELDVNFIFVKIILTNEAKQNIVIEDRLETTIQNLCLHSSQKLLAGEDYSYRVWDYDETISIKNEGQSITIQDANSKATSFIKQDFITALLEIAKDGLELIQKLEINYSDYNFSTEPYLKGLFARCKDLYDATYIKQ